MKVSNSDESENDEFSNETKNSLKVIILLFELTIYDLIFFLNLNQVTPDDIIRRVENIEKTNLQILSLLQTFTDNNKNKRIKSSHKVSICEVSEFYVDSERFSNALAAGTGCAFASRILSALFPKVAELYNTTWSGQAARTKDKSDLERKKRTRPKQAGSFN